MDTPIEKSLLIRWLAHSQETVCDARESQRLVRDTLAVLGMPCQHRYNVLWPNTCLACGQKRREGRQ